jgi:hypothetical protein
VSAVQVGRVAGKRWPRTRRGGTGWLTDSDGDEWGPNDKEAAELSSASVAIGGVGGRTRTGVDAESEGSGVVPVGGLAQSHG